MLADSARVLGYLLRWVPKIVEFNRSRILNTIIDKLSTLLDNPSQCNCVMNPEIEAREYLLVCICILAELRDAQLDEHMERLVPLVAHEVTDSTTKGKQMVAVRTMGKVCDCARFFINMGVHFLRSNRGLYFNA